LHQIKLVVTLLYWFMNHLGGSIQYEYELASCGALLRAFTYALVEHENTVIDVSSSSPEEDDSAHMVQVVRTA